MRFLILFAFLFSLELTARPPVDLIFPSGTSFQKRKKRLTDKDIIFTDVGTLTPQEKINQAISAHPGKIYIVTSNSFGRQLPTRDSKKISKLHKKTHVKLVKKSQSRRWALVEKIETGKKSWLPLVNLDLVN